MAKEMPDSNGPVNSTEPDRPVAAASMPGGIFDRRHFLGGAALAGLGAAGAGLGVGRLARQQPPQPSAETANPQSTADLHGMAGPQGPGNDSHKYYLNVYDFGARGNGRADDTAAIQRALDAAAKKGGIVAAPSGGYLIKSHLTIPSGVTLEGVARATARPHWRPPAVPHLQGTTLLAVGGAGNPDGEPFITIRENGTLKGVTIFYPEQVPMSSDDPKAQVVPYPWTARGGAPDGIGQNVSILDVLMINPYQAVDLGTYPCARHWINGLLGQPLRTGVFIDQCGDVGRLENVHFWGFGASAYDRFTLGATAFRIGRTDWQYMFNTFAWGYDIGYHFVKTPHGCCNGNFLGVGADGSGRAAVVVEDSQFPGLLITNGEFTAFQNPNSPGTIQIEPGNHGPVCLQNCSFWGASNHIGTLRGQGPVSFEGCTFATWDRHNRGDPALLLDGAPTTVSGCVFNKVGSGTVAARITPHCPSALIVGNRRVGKDFIVQRPTRLSSKRFRIGMNVATEE